MPLSGLLAEHGPWNGWPSIFYFFGLIGAVWSIMFLLMVDEDPESCKKISDDERKFIISSVWGAAGVSVSHPEFLNQLKDWRYFDFLCSKFLMVSDYKVMFVQLKC